MENIKLTIAFEAPDLNKEELEDETKQLLKQLGEMEEVKKVDRERDQNPPSDGMGIGALIGGILLAEVNGENLRKVIGAVWTQFNKPGNTKKLELFLKNPETGEERSFKSEGFSAAELESLLREVGNFLGSTQENVNG